MKLFCTLILIINFSAFGQKADMEKYSAPVPLTKNYDYRGFGVLNKRTNDTILACIYDKISISKNEKFIFDSADAVWESDGNFYQN